MLPKDLKRNQNIWFSVFLITIGLLLFWIGRFESISKSQLQQFFPRFYAIVFLIANNLALFYLLLVAFFLFLMIRILSIKSLISITIGKYPKELLLLVVSAIIVLMISEVVLRWGFGFKPYNHQRLVYLKEVKDLKLLTGYIADSDGITRADSQVAADIARSISLLKNDPQKLRSFQLPDTVDPSIYYSIYNSCDIIYGDTNSAFARAYQQIVSIPNSQRTDLQQGILQYVDEPYNRDGYRSIPFRDYKSGKKKVLLLGDSFTWGGVAEPISNCFADLLLTMGYTVYNTGIPATDPEQYRAVAKKYIQILKPDVVVVNLFTGNDVSNYERRVQPFAPVYYPTNAGNIMACPQGLYFNNMKEAYHITLSWYKIPTEKNWFNRLCAQTSVTSVFWSVLATYDWVEKESELLKTYNAKTGKFRESGPVCQRIVSDIKQLAAHNNAQFIYSQIPDYTKKGMHLPKDEPGYADTLTYFVPSVKAEDYSGVGGHFNNKGHYKYALYLQHLIDSVCETKLP